MEHRSKQFGDDLVPLLSHPANEVLPRFSVISEGRNGLIQGLVSESSPAAVQRMSKRNLWVDEFGPMLLEVEALEEW
jgi:hypothetical protein